MDDVVIGWIGTGVTGRGKNNRGMGSIGFVRRGRCDFELEMGKIGFVWKYSVKQSV